MDVTKYTQLIIKQAEVCEGCARYSRRCLRTAVERDGVGNPISAVILLGLMKVTAQPGEAQP